MAIRTSTLYAAAARGASTAYRKTLHEAVAANKQTAFLCHSHQDRRLVEGLLVLLYESGWDIYVDWRDHEMPRSPNKETAGRIREKIETLDWFLFLATAESVTSRWCPWEIGIADRAKPIDRIVIIPTIDVTGTHHGNEYLQLYSQVTEATSGDLARFPAGSDTGGTWLRNL